MLAAIGDVTLRRDAVTCVHVPVSRPLHPALAPPLLRAAARVPATGGGAMKKGALAHLAAPGGEIVLRVTPRAARNAVEETPAGLRVWVTAAPEGGKANKAATRLLADALGVARTRLSLLRGATSRDKVFRLD